MALSLNRLRAFHAVIEEGSITAAARKLHLSQPAVSKQISELESQLGILLVDRLARGVRLTRAGVVLAHHARRLLQEEDAAERAIHELLGLKKGHLAVGASTTIGSYLIPRVFGALRGGSPDVTLDLQIGNTAQIQHQLLAGKLDVGLTEGFIASGDLHSEVLTRDELVLIASPSHDFARAGAVSIASLSAVPFILREKGSGTRDVEESALAEKGVHPNVVMSLGSTEAIKSAVRMGLGVALVSRLTVEFEVEHGRLAIVPIDDFEIRRSFHLLTLRGHGLSPIAEEFLRLLRACHPEEGDSAVV